MLVTALVPRAIDVGVRRLSARRRRRKRGGVPAAAPGRGRRHLPAGGPRGGGVRGLPGRGAAMRPFYDAPTLLGVWAHPDDEAYCSSGLMARVRDAGGRVVVVTATRGEQGTDDPVAWPPEVLGPLREQALPGEPGGGRCPRAPVADLPRRRARRRAA